LAFSRPTGIFEQFLEFGATGVSGAERVVQLTNQSFEANAG
jgi:hypothetical protein